jgi:hypothetical protein
MLPQPTIPITWQVPIVQELHAQREQLVAKYQVICTLIQKPAFAIPGRQASLLKTLDSVKKSLATP